MRVDNAGVEIDFDRTGDGFPVILLHGFPDTRRLWRHQVPALVENGFSVITPDLRGYGRSDKPEGVESYSIPLLATDVMAILDHLGIERANVVGHDWGAAVAWTIGSLLPDRTERLVALSVGHPSSFFRAGYAQLEKSWYMLLFQFVGTAERWLSQDGWAKFREWAHHPDAQQVVSDMERSGSLTPALNYYRANVPPDALLQPQIEIPDIEAPTMGVWSSGDVALTEVQMTGSSAYVKGPWRYERIDGPGHWLQLEAPEEINGLLIDFLAG